MITPVDAPVPTAVEVAVAPRLASLVVGSAAARLRARLMSRLDELCVRLGVPDHPTVELVTHESSPPVQVHVQGVLVPYSPTLASRIWPVVVTEHLWALLRDPDRAESRDSPYDHFLRSATLLDGQGDAGRELVAEAVCELVVQAIGERPGCLVSAASNTGRALAGLLDLGVSVAAAGDYFVEPEEMPADRWCADAVEGAFSLLRSRVVEVHASRECLSAILGGFPVTATTPLSNPQVSDEARAAIERVNERLGLELGLRLPDVVFTPSTVLPDAQVRIQVNDRVEPVVLGLHADAAPVDVLAEAIFAAVTRRADQLLSAIDVQYYLARLEETFPDLVEVATERFSEGELARVLRGLLRERIPIRDLRGILERLVQFDTVTVAAELYGGSTVYTILDPRLPMPRQATSGSAVVWRRHLAFLRHGLRDLVTDRALGGASRLSALEVARELEARAEVAEWRDGQVGSLLDDHEWERVTELLWRALGECSPDDSLVLVTTPVARAVLRDLVAAEFPDLPVLARDEIPPEIPLVILGRISLENAA